MDSASDNGAGARPLVSGQGVRHVKGLDGLRGIAVLGVLFVHVGAPGASFGWLGVDLFFVLSGFLITSLLLAESELTGRISLLKFWARRFLRLMPAYWLYACFISYLILVRRWGWLEIHYGWSPEVLVASIWLYFVNYVPQGGIWEHQHFTLHLWSLAVEEQFYLVWPILFSIGLWLDRRLVALFAWAVVVAIVALRCFLEDPMFGVRITIESRGFGIVLGCAVALLFPARKTAPIYRAFGAPPVKWGAAIGAVFLYAATVAASRWLGLTEAATKRYLSPLFCALFATVIAAIWCDPKGLLVRLLEWRPLAFVGKISYGIYLYHMACQYVVWDLLTPELGETNRFVKYGLRLALFIGMSIGVAALSYYLIERPFLRLKRTLRPSEIAKK